MAVPFAEVRLVLHAGVQKTGTSYIQRQLQRARPGLRRDGIVVPRFFNEFGLGHHNLWSSIRGEPLDFTQRTSFSQMDRERRLAILHASTAPTIALSSERLFHLPRPALAEFAAASAREIRVVVFIRRRSDLMTSIWRSEAKWRPHKPFHDYVDAALARQHGLPALRGPFRKMRQILGEDAVRVVHYDGAVARGEDLAELVFRAAGSEIPEALVELPETPRVNESCTMIEAELMRMVHERALQQSSGFGGRAILRSLRALQTHAGPLVEDALGHIADTADGEISLRWIDQHYEAEDAELLDLFGESMLCRPDGPLFADHGDAAVPRLHADLSSDRRLRRCVDRLIPELQRELARQRGPAY